MEEQKLYRVEENARETIYDKVNDYLKKYDVRYNEISHNIQIKLIGKSEWYDLNLNSLLIELTQADIQISMGKLEIFIKSEFIKKHNPIQSYFESVKKWDGVDYIEKLASYVSSYEDEEFLYHLRKWLVRAIKCALEPNYFNKQCFVIVHKGQSSGKSTFCRFLCPPDLSDYLAEDIANDKDARIQLCRNFIINLDELSVLAKKEINSLKAFFSKSFINERLPYDRKNTVLPRVCSFIGSTNMSTFLSDETGSVRWLVFELKDKIDFDYSKDIDINNVWSQAYHLAYNDPTFNAELTVEDVNTNEERNYKYRNLTTEEELIAKYYKKSNLMDDFVTATDIMTSLGSLNLRLNKINIGRALSGFNYQKVKHPKKQVYGYLAKKH
ncbi:virulence-associated E family protein [Tenacibaculum dicentrarchi]|uniref:VapE domain-containing protein n=2 Tax=Tenacibaculum finnmarkense TaxID=2781243 RepID=UPI00187B6196|nr:VapE domain-containing protein [Tenacibaculum finnmarkense]MCD8414584.1 virulence-associated E family protein [Tenacibaculum dicentrarchi]MBE7645383.1 virulence-associated E family protein [Tenacibaculum finnmarkense genomovar ulcerans]MCD8419897.1 virulence-associated E family protein [Tenacibaculum dicentrarchi]MCD8437093.1 virulence-associated E family protein [Tenacibaculum dicentrarchi]MCD8452152.1 virulence-associated E family protein [Tenacibaculum dicentrarchi]